MKKLSPFAFTANGDSCRYNIVHNKVVRLFPNNLFSDFELPFTGTVDTMERPSGMVQGETGRGKAFVVIYLIGGVHIMAHQREFTARHGGARLPKLLFSKTSAKLLVIRIVERPHHIVETFLTMGQTQNLDVHEQTQNGAFIVIGDAGGGPVCVTVEEIEPDVVAALAKTHVAVSLVALHSAQGFR